MQRTAQQPIDELLCDGVAVSRVAEPLGRATADHLIAGHVDDDDADARHGERACEPIALDERGLGVALRRFECVLEAFVGPPAPQPNRPVM